MTVIQAEFSRYVVDVNRPHISETLAGRYNKAAVYTSDTWHDPILVDDTVDLMIAPRMNDYYHPYHTALDQLVHKTKQQFGHTYLFDLHSFGEPIDESICLGSRKNNQTAPILHPLTYTSLSRNFSTIAQNKIFRGGFITQKYGAIDDVEALQIELKYDQYLKDGTYEGGNRIPDIDLEKFEYTKERLKRAFQEIIQATLAKRPKTCYSLGSHSAAISLVRRAP